MNLYPSNDGPSTSAVRPGDDESNLNVIWTEPDRLRIAYLWRQLNSRYMAVGNADDLNYATAIVQLLLKITPSDHPARFAVLAGLGLAQRGRFERQSGSNPDGLEDAITSSRQAVELTPDDHPKKPSLLANLGVVLHQRFESVGSTEDLRASIVALTRAITLTPKGDPDRPSRMNSLGIVQQACYQRLGNPDDLEAAVTTLRQATELEAAEHPQKPTWMNNLGVAYQARFERFGNLDDLDASIVAVDKAINLAPDGHPYKAAWLNNLGSSYQARFSQLGELADLEAAIVALRRSSYLTSDHHLDKPMTLSNLSGAYQTRFERLGVLNDLQESIEALSQAVKLTPDDHPQKCSRLINLGSAQLSRFERLGYLDDLETAVASKRHAVRLIPEGHTEKPALLAGLGVAQKRQFQYHGRLEDSEASIASMELAVKLTPDDHPDMAARMSALAVTQHDRFVHLGNLDDLEAAIAAQSRSIELTPDGHPQKPSRLGNLGISLHARYERLGDPDDLNTAISAKCLGIKLTPEGHPDKAAWSNNLGNAQQARFQLLGDLDDLDAAISSHRQAINLTPDARRPQNPMWLNNLGNAYQARFACTKAPEDIEMAVASHSRAVELILAGHSSQAGLLANVSRSLVARMRSPNATPDDLSAATEAGLAALVERSGDPMKRLNAGTRLISLLSDPLSLASTDVLLQVHQRVLDLVPQIVWLGHDVNRQYQELGSDELEMLYNHAAAAAIAAGQYQRAVEWLESGRSIVWSQVLHLPTPLDCLRCEHPQLASEFERISQALRKHSVDTPDMQARSQYYGLAIQYDKLAELIGRLRGFENFLQPRPFAQLVSACASGYVVMINVHTSRCDALILHQPGDVRHVPLLSFSFNWAKKLQEKLYDALSTANDEEEGEREIIHKRNHTGHEVLAEILAALWREVVQPVLEAIRQLLLTTPVSSGTLPHITWCPTGPLAFLPLHAAGIYTDKDHPEILMDVAVSSYTPTLNLLLRQQMSFAKSSDSASHTRLLPKVLVVSQPITPSKPETAIPSTTLDAEFISSLFPLSTRILAGHEATVDTVLEDMAAYDWVHLAYHGIQNPHDPMQSAFALHDGPLSLAALMNKALPHAELAVLSACQTTTGEEKSSEETVRLVAAMLNVGFKSVVGTMWSISDRAALEMAKIFYKELRGQVEAGGVIRPAYALHEAIKVLRQTEDLIQWVPFVHFGL